MEYQLCDNIPGLWDAFEAGNRAQFEHLKETALVEATGVEKSYAKQ